MVSVMAESSQSEAGLRPLVSSAPAVTDAERELAKQCATEFNKGSIDACLGHLNKLTATRGEDARVKHNQAIVDFIKSGFYKTDEFLQRLKSVCFQMHIDVDNVVGLDDVDQCVMYYNKAVILYFLRQYRKALDITDKLLQYIEAMEENLRRNVLFLAVELYLSTYQPEKAIGMLSFIEKQVFGNKAQTPEKERDSKDLGSKEKEGKSEKDNKAKEAKYDAYKPRLSQYKVRCYIMLKSIKSSKREMKSLSNLQGMTAPVVYLRSNFECIRGNYRKAMKVLNSAPSPVKINYETGQSHLVMYYNNLGVIHFYLNKPNLGVFYLRKALQENEDVCKSIFKVNPGKSLSGCPIQCLGISRHYEIQYNMGLQLLHCQRPLDAFNCLVDTISVYRNNPRLWLRLAECCIMVHKKDNDEDKVLEKRLEVVQSTVGSGVHRKLILGTGPAQRRPKSDSTWVPASTLEFALMCLRNALLLLPEDPLDVKEEVTSEDESTPKPNLELQYTQASPGNPIKFADLCNLRCSILASSAYVSLCLNDHMMAYIYADKLLKQPSISPALNYIGHMYLAEAMVALDKIADAVQHLNPDNVTDISTTCPESRSELDKNGDKNSDPPDPTEVTTRVSSWSPSDLTEARAIMRYNLATAHTIRGEYEKALSHLNQSTADLGQPLPSHIYYLNIYLQLMEGKRKVALDVIKDNFGHISNKF